MTTYALPENIESGYRVKYAVDMVLCIDGTQSMFPFIESVKQSALDFHEHLLQAMASKGKHVDQMRIRVIVFRDYWADSPSMVMLESPMLDMAAESETFASFVRTISAIGGGDAPENALEALALAIDSDWELSSEFAKKRHVIVLWTDTTAHPFERPNKPANYPPDMPKNLDDLMERWDSMLAHRSKRLVLFCPDIEPWIEISESWENVTHFPVAAGEGMDDTNLEGILDDIASSL